MTHRYINPLAAVLKNYNSPEKILDITKYTTMQENVGTSTTIQTQTYNIDEYINKCNFDSLKHFNGCPFEDKNVGKLICKFNVTIDNDQFYWISKTDKAIIVTMKICDLDQQSKVYAKHLERITSNQLRNSYYRPFPLFLLLFAQFRYP